MPRKEPPTTTTLVQGLAWVIWATVTLACLSTAKITVTDNVSVRPGVISDLDFGSDGETVFLAPVTYDLDGLTEDGRLLPYVGGGLSVSTEGNGAVGPLVTGGVDYRLTDRLVANGAVHWSIYGDSQVNGSVGLGYTF